MWANIYREDDGKIIVKAQVFKRLPTRKIPPGCSVFYTQEYTDAEYIDDVNPYAFYSFLKGKAVLPDRKPRKPNLPDEGFRSDDVAVIRTIGLGDVIMTIPMLYALKSAGFTITYYTSEYALPMLADIDAIDRYQVLNVEFAKEGLPKAPPKVRKRHKRIINLVNRVDFGPIVRMRPRADNFIYVASRQLKVDLSIDRDFIVPEFKSIDKDWGHELLEINGAKRPVIACQVTSRGLPRFWPWDKWINLAVSMPDFTFVFISDEKKLARKKVPDNVINTSGLIDTYELICLVSACDLIVCPDSGLMHIGARLRKPVVLLCGSTDPEKHIAYYPRDLYKFVWCEPRMKCSPCYDWQIESCFGKPSWPICMTRIRVEQVKKAILEVIG